jgi:chromosome segregation ATPase
MAGPRDATPARYPGGQKQTDCNKPKHLAAAETEVARAQEVLDRAKRSLKEAQDQKETIEKAQKQAGDDLGAMLDIMKDFGPEFRLFFEKAEEYIG